MESSRMQAMKSTDIFWRGLYGIDHGGSSWVVEVDYFDPSETVKVYRDGVLVTKGRSPLRFDIDPSARVEAAMSLYGMKRAHMVDVRSGNATRLQPLPGTAEDRRLRFEGEHPAASRVIAAVAWCVLAIALVTQIPNTVNSLGGLVETFSLPIPRPDVPTFALPGWLNGLLGVAGILAGLDRGLRMKHNALLDD